MDMLFAQVALPDNWPGALASIFASLMAIAGIVSPLVVLWLRTNTLRKENATLKSQMKECVDLCKACETQRKADQDQHAEELAKRDAAWNADPPSWNSGGKEIIEKVSQAMEHLPVSPRHYHKIMEAVLERRRKS